MTRFKFRSAWDRLARPGQLVVSRRKILERGDKLSLGVLGPKRNGVRFARSVPEKIPETAPEIFLSVMMELSLEMERLDALTVSKFILQSILALGFWLLASSQESTVEQVFFRRSESCLSVKNVLIA